LFAPCGYTVEHSRNSSLPLGPWLSTTQCAHERHKTSLAMESETEILFSSNLLDISSLAAIQDPSAIASSRPPKLSADMGPWTRRDREAQVYDGHIYI
jgi:hypothetical protein